MPDHSLRDALERGASIETLALSFARDAYPALALEDGLASLDAWAEPLRAAGIASLAPREQAKRLRAHLHDQLELRGDPENYHDPRNSFLNEVISRRVGLPISLTVVWIAVGRRAGVLVEGIGFPGHFLARVGGAEGVLVDPFADGAEVDEPALIRLATLHVGGVERLMPEHLAPVETRVMLVRMLVNLKHAYERRGDHARALVVTDRLVELTELPAFVRDRGLLSAQLGAVAAATADLDRYLASGAPEGDVARVRAVRDSLQARKRVLS